MRTTCLLQSILVALIVAVFGLIVPGSISAKTIRVDLNGGGDYLTIQEGIDTVSDGDTVLVIDGIYTGVGNKDLDFNGKPIVVTSENGAKFTIIDCQEEGIGFYFRNSEGLTSVVRGFTIRNGKATISDMILGGIHCHESSPTITNNIITDSPGVAITCGNGCAALITNNVIVNTYGNVCAGHGSSPKIINNVIAGNSEWGIWIVVNSTPIIMNNIIVNNRQGISRGWEGGEPTILYNDVWSSPDGNYVSHVGQISSDLGDISEDPLFVDPENGDYHLQPGSPCTNAGHPDVAYNDPDGTRNDIGAYGGPDAAGWSAFVERTKGDINADAVVDVRDAILCLRIAAGLALATTETAVRITPTAYEKWAADMDGDGKITSADALLILYESVGRLIAEPKLLASSNLETTVKLPQITALPGQTVTVPILVEGCRDVFGADIKLVYDPVFLTILGVETGASGSLMAVNTQNSGQIVAALVNPKGMVGGNGEIIRVTLQAKGEVSSGVYLCRLVADGEHWSRTVKIVLLR